ncbi:MAG: DUF4492 domain-containing protein [Prevotella sp.]|nr:DUF4492 domain-containing protein [Prevotella sp.]
MKKNSFLYRAFDLYYDGFRNMTLGKTLWAIIIVKLVIIFAVLKLFFFPNYIDQHAEEGDEADFVATELIDRAIPTP